MRTDLAELFNRHESLSHWLLDDALPLWWSLGADHKSGGFHEAIDLTGRPVLSERRARVQARQIFTFKVGGALGWTGPWREAVAHGLDFFIGRYRRPDGLFWNSLTASGDPVQERPRLYEQAFALLAFATASGAADADAALVSIADALFERLSRDRRGKAGGFTGFVDEDVFQTDPHMHLLEAALAWEEVSANAIWRLLADEIAELCLARFMPGESGALLEYFDPTWAPAGGLAGHLVWPGHQFEWAGLLERWGLARGRDDARAVARRLFHIGASYGIDPVRGVALFELTDDMRAHDTKARLWSQTEWLKAAVILARSEPASPVQTEYINLATNAADALILYLNPSITGLWRDKLLSNGAWVEEPSPASSFYHIIDAIRVLSDWTDELQSVADIPK